MEKPKLISTWEELAVCESETHVVELDEDFGGGSGWIRHKNAAENGESFFKNNHYLSTHTFYGSNYKQSTKLLQECGFNVRLANWDELI